jgi:hypothetical protein
MRFTAWSRTHIPALSRTIARVGSKRQFDTELIPEEVAAEVLGVQFADCLTAVGITTLRRVIMDEAAVPRCFIAALNVRRAIFCVFLCHLGADIVPLCVTAVGIFAAHFDAAWSIAATLPQVTEETRPIEWRSAPG